LSDHALLENVRVRLIRRRGGCPQAVMFRQYSWMPNSDRE
jgi:hypothetical protein